MRSEEEVRVLDLPTGCKWSQEKKRNQGKLRLLARKLGGCWYCLLSWERKRRELERVWIGSRELWLGTAGLE